MTSERIALILAAAAALFVNTVAAYAVDPDLIAAYGFEEASGSIAGDGSSSGNPGYLTGSTRDSNGKFGQAILLDGLNDWVGVPSSASFTGLRRALTLEAWVKPTSLSGVSPLFFKTGVQSPYGLDANTLTDVPGAQATTEAGSLSAPGTSQLAILVWTHLALTYDGSQLRLYVNGVLAGSGALTGDLVSSTGELLIGKETLTNKLFNGLIDEVRVYRRALNASEILTDMNTSVSSQAGTDTAAPAVFISEPANGATVGGITTVAAVATDNFGVAGVQFILNGANFGSEDTSPPYEVAWNTSASGNGSHTWYARARDISGNITQATAVTVTATDTLGFVESTVFSGMTSPTAVRFAPNGQVFVTERGGRVKVFDNLSDPTPTVFADLRIKVHSFWDRGLLGLALHPDYPSTPYVYVLYTYDAAIGGTAPTWGGGTDTDGCATPPGPTADGCVVSGRLSRLEADGNVMTGSEQVLIEAWGQQYPSHTIGSLAFHNGALYVSGGDGASFTFSDYGQKGIPTNPLGDTPVPVGTQQTTPTAEGGALRSLSPLRASGGPILLNGSILRVDPDTGAGLPDNPWFSSSDANARRVIAYGLRNPFRFAVRPGNGDIWIGDVGWADWEEIDRIPNPVGAVVENFGWPCYEGVDHQAGYDSLNLDLCEVLYGQSNAVTAPYYHYRHTDPVVPGESCPTGSSSLSGVAFYPGGDYPATYNGAMFFADYSRDCIWVMFQGANGNPDPAQRQTFKAGAKNPVDLQIGPGGDLFYVDFNEGKIRRLQYFQGNRPPTAVLAANPTSGPLPLTVAFDGLSSIDPDGGDTLTYVWDLDDDGQFDDGTGVQVVYTYTQPGTVTTRLKVTDSFGANTTDTKDITAANSPPTATIDSPQASLTWKVGDTINFSGSATDPDQGTLPASAFSWDLIMHHCPSNCHAHLIQTFPGISSGSLIAPDHEYPSHLELKLTVTDDGGLQDTHSLLLQPQTVNLTFQTVPAGLKLGFLTEAPTAPFTRTVIVGSQVSVAATSPQTLGNQTYTFSAWSDGQAQNHLITAPAAAQTYTCSFTNTTLAYQESGGQVVFEAEHYDARVARSGKNWELQSSLAGFVGEGYMIALPNTGFNQGAGYSTLSPETIYNVKITTPGTYYVWLRWAGAADNDDSAHVGVDGQETTSADRMSVVPDTWAWTQTTMDGPVATVHFSSPGLHTVHLWMREDGTPVDRILLRTSSSPTPPAGNGPAESGRVSGVSDTTPPQISSLGASGISPSAATITWQTDEPATSQVEYGTTTSYGSSTPLDPNLVSSHSVGLSGLSGGTLYNYRVHSIDFAGNPAVSANQMFTTAAPPASGPFLESGGQVVMEAEHFKTNIPRGTWNWQLETAQVGFAGEGYMSPQPNSGWNQSSNYQNTVPELVYEVNFTSTGIYYVWVRGAGPTGADDSLHAGVDNTAPATADHISIPSSNWVWSRNTADATPATITVSSPGVHTIHVWMREDGLRFDRLLLRTDSSATPPSGSGPPESPRQGGGDTTAPIISNVQLTSVSSTTATITWETDEPSDSQVEYGITTAYGSVTPLNPALVISHRVTVTGLTPATLYNFRVRSRDAALNMAQSTNGTFITAAPSSGPFQESGGQVVIEAEHYDAKTPRGGWDWVSETVLPGFAGESHMTALPNVGANLNSNIETTLPELVYNVNFASTGTYYVWVRGAGPTVADDSVHAGLDGQAMTSSDKIFLPGATWVWSRGTQDGPVATIQVVAPGEHTVHLWMREDGSQVDRFLLRLDSSSTPPAGSGPAESPRQGGDTTAPQITVVQSSAVTSTTAAITWQTDEPATSRVEYGTTTAYGTLTTLDPTLTTAHNVGLTGLSAGTLYHYRVHSSDAAGNPAVSGDQTFAATPSGTGPFQESDGQVVMEAEHFKTNIPRGSWNWQLETAQAGFVAEGYMSPLPNSGWNQNSNYQTTMPEMVYEVNFTTAGTYYIWVRGGAPSDSDDSLHVGVDNTAPASADRLGIHAAGWVWSRNTADALPATIVIPASGIHTIHIWMREDGVRIDRLLLRTDPSATPPSDPGPPESPRAL